MEYKNLNQIPTYPEYNYDNADDIDRDIDYMKQLCPKAVRAIQQEVDEECDKLEYDGSCMFDEHPSCEHLDTIVDAIYDRILESSPDRFSMQSLQVLPQRQPGQQPPWGPPPFRPPQPSRPSRPPRPDFRPDGSPDWLRYLISTLLYNEMAQRRRRYRRRKRPYQSY